jgi:hypothetical protein
MFVWVAISYQLQKPIHRIWMNMAHLSVIALNLATCVGDNVQCSQKLFNLGNPFLSRILIQKLLKYSVFFERVRLYIYISYFFSLHFSCLLQILQLIELQQMSKLLGFTPVFDMEKSLFLWYVLWLWLCAPKFYPKKNYPNYLQTF